MLTVFTTKTCGQCKMVKKILNHYGCKYNMVDIEENPDFQKLLLEKTGRITVPVTTNGKEYVVGYNVAQIKALV